MTLSPEARALLDAIAGSESAGRYDVMYGGGRFDPALGHPHQAVPITTGPNAGKTSSAAGRYQFLGSTWDDVAAQHGLSDFSPQSQDLGAWFLAADEYKRDTGRDLQADLAAGRSNDVARSLSDIWTSLPGGIEQGQTANAFSGKIMNQPQPLLGAFVTAPAPAPMQPAPQPMAMPPSPYPTPGALPGTALAHDPGGTLGRIAAMYLQQSGQQATAASAAKADAEARRQALLSQPLWA